MEEKILDSQGNEQKIDGVFFVGKKIFKIPKDPSTVPSNPADIFQILNSKFINPNDLEMMMSTINLLKAKNKSNLLPYFTTWKSKVKSSILKKNEYAKKLADHKSMLEKLVKNNEKNRNKSHDSKNDTNNPNNTNKNPKSNDNNNTNLINNTLKNENKNINDNNNNYNNLMKNKSNMDSQDKKGNSNNNPDEKKDKPDVKKILAKNLELIGALINKSKKKENDYTNEDTENSNKIQNKSSTLNYPKNFVIADSKDKINSSPSKINNNNNENQNPSKSNSNSTHNNDKNNSTFDKKKSSTAKDNTGNPTPIKNNPNKTLSDNLNFMEIPSLSNQRFDLDDDFIPQEEHEPSQQTDEEEENNEDAKGDLKPTIKVNVQKSTYGNGNKGNQGAEMDEAISNFKNKKNQKKKLNESNDEVQSGINSDEELNDFYNHDASYYNDEHHNDSKNKNVNPNNSSSNNNNNNNNKDNKNNSNKKNKNNSSSTILNNAQNSNDNKNKDNRNNQNNKGDLNENKGKETDEDKDENFSDNSSKDADGKRPVDYKEISRDRSVKPNNNNQGHLSNDSRILQLENVESIGFVEVTENPMRGNFNNNFMITLPKSKGVVMRDNKLQSQHISSMSISGVNQSNCDIAPQHANKPSESSLTLKNPASNFSADLDNKNANDDNINYNKNEKQNSLSSDSKGNLNNNYDKNPYSFRNLNNKYPDINNNNDNFENMEHKSTSDPNMKDRFSADADNEKILISVADLKLLKATMLKIGSRMSLIVRKKETKSLRNVFDTLKKNANLHCKVEPFLSKFHSKNNSLKSINIINADVSNRIFSNDNSLIIPAANSNNVTSPINNLRLINPNNNNYINNLNNKGNQSLNNEDANKPNNPINKGLNNNNLNNNNYNLINNPYLMDQIPSDYENENFVTEENNSAAIDKANELNVNNTSNKLSLNNHSNYLNTNHSANESNPQNTYENKANTPDFNISKQKSNQNQTHSNKILIKENMNFSDDYNQDQNVINWNNNINNGSKEIPDKNNDPEFLKFVITELNGAMDKLINRVNALNKDIANKNKIIANHALNVNVLKERNKLQDEIKTELELLNKNIKSLDNPVYLGNPTFEKNLNVINDRYKNLNLKIEIVKLHENLANKEIIINDLKLIIELSRDEIALLENSNKKHLKEKEILASSLKNKENSYKFTYFTDNADASIKHSTPSKSDKTKEKELQRQMDEKIKHALASKEAELASKFKEKEFIIREDCSRQVYETNKVLQEKILQNERLIFEMEILKSKLHNKDLEEREKLEELKQRLFLLETENEKLLLTNKMNNEIIAQLEAKSYSSLANNLAEKERIVDTDLSTGGNLNNNFVDEKNSSGFKTQNPFNKQKQFFKNEILIVELKSQISKLENSLEAKDKLIENLKDKIKAYSNDNLRKEYELKHNLFEVKNKELNEFYLKLQSLENERKSLLEENESLRSELTEAHGKIKELEDSIVNKYIGIESALEKEKGDKAGLENKLKEISQFYKDNHEILLEEADDFRQLVSRKDQEMEKMKAFYEKRIQQLKTNIDEMEHFRKNIIDELAGKKPKDDRSLINHSQNATEENKYNSVNSNNEYLPERYGNSNKNDNAKSQTGNFFSNTLSSSFHNHPNPSSKRYKYLYKDNYYPKLASKRDDFSQSFIKEKTYQPYFFSDNILSDRQPDKKIKLNMNFNINPTIDSKHDRGLKNPMSKVDYNYNTINNNNYLN